MDIRFKLERDTKNTYRFFEVNDDGSNAMEMGNHIVGSLYVQKAVFKAKPEEITITLHLDGDGDDDE